MTAAASSIELHARLVSWAVALFSTHIRKPDVPPLLRAATPALSLLFPAA